MFRDAARSSIGSHMPAKSLELKHTIKLIQELTAEIDEIEAAIKRIMDEEIQSPILTIPGISYRMGAMILAEIGDFSRFDSADKILAYAGISPSTYQSGQLDNCYSHMEKRGSRYLRYALYNATKYQDIIVSASYRIDIFLHDHFSAHNISHRYFQGRKLNICRK